MIDERHACHDLVQNVRHFLDLKGEHRPTETRYETRHSTICTACLQIWPCDIEELRKALANYDEFMEGK